MFRSLRGLGCSFFVVTVVITGIVVWGILLLYGHVIVPTFHTPPLKTTPLNGP